MPFHNTLLTDVRDRLQYLLTVEELEWDHYHELLLLAGTNEDRRRAERRHTLQMRDLHERLDRVYRYFDRHGLHELSL